VLCLQEVRAGDDDIVAALGEGWHIVHAEASAKGRAGVAVASRHVPRAVRVGLSAPPGVDTAGRWVELDLALRPHGAGDCETLTVASVYVHTGAAGTPRQVEKEAFLVALARRLRQLAGDGRHVLGCGDYNIAHREVDLKNWQGNLGRAGFLPGERSWFDALLADECTAAQRGGAVAGFVDVHRSLAGPGPGPYTWWSWRGRAFDNDAGWRLDYQIACAALAERAVAAWVDRAGSYAERWSDHSPLIVEYDVTATSGPSPLP